MSDKWDILYILSEEELLSSLLFSPPFKDFSFFFFPCLLFGLKFRLFVRYCMQGMVKIYPTTPLNKLPALGDLEQLNWQQANMT
jgi:hypothetical protein